MDNKIIANAIKIERERRKITIREFAAKTGLKESTIVRFEKGENSPLLSNLIKMLDVLGMQLFVVKKSERNTQLMELLLTEFTS